MPLDNYSNTASDSSQPYNQSYSSLLKELGSSAKDLMRSEILLVTTELKTVSQRVARHSAQAAAFGGLLVMSLFPFLAFLVIGLGELLDGRYWLSSLIVAIACAAIGGPLAYRAFKKIKEEDLDFTRSRTSLEHGAHSIQAKVDEIKDAARGERHETNKYH